MYSVDTQAPQPTNMTNVNFQTAKIVRSCRFGASECPKAYVQNVLAPPDAQNLTYKTFWSLLMPKTLRTKRLGASRGPKPYVHSDSGRPRVNHKNFYEIIKIFMIWLFED